MRDPLRRLDGWAVMARREPGPELDVRRRVLERLGRSAGPQVSGAGGPAGPAVDRVLVWFAAAATAAAGVAVVSAAGVYRELSDPVWALLDAARVFRP